MERFRGISIDVMRRMERFREKLRERPHLYASITEVLSPWITIFTSNRSCCATSHIHANSVAIDSAQPISRPSAFQPGNILQAPTWNL